ncbi:MAG TPA: ATP-binding protein [Candidatus Scalindua sp.]|nr:ATP-binding protein [Candidatus Scalindua sp.]
MVKRILFDEIKEWLLEDKIIIIKGTRRAGKTTLLSQIRDYLSEYGEKTVYISVDQELTNPIFSEPKYFIRYLKEQYGVDEEKRTYILLDEFQYIKEAGLFLKVVYDIAHKYLTIIATGSSSLEISKNREFLTGRKVEFILNRFSFVEFLWGTSEYKYDYSWNLSRDIKDLKEFYALYKEDLERRFLDYINWGGYPEVCLQGNFKKKETLLRKIIRTYIQKDIVDFLKVGNVSAFNNLISLLSHQVGNLLNKVEVCNTLGIHFKTLENYLDVLKGTFIFSFLKPFYTNIRKELSKMPKIYAEDMGVIRYSTGRSFTDFRVIEGNVIENFLYNHLSLSFSEENIHFYRTISKSEIDFIIKDKDRLIPMEVKFQKNANVPVSVRNFSKNYADRIDYNIVVTLDKLDFQSNTYFIPVLLLPFVRFDK